MLGISAFFRSSLAARPPGLAVIAGFAVGLALLHGWAPAAQAATTVVIVNAQSPYRFSPNVINISAGDTVRWAPTGTTPHTITSDGCVYPAAGACTFDSGSAVFIRNGTDRPTFEFRFDQPGVYPFFCRLHGAPGGVGQSGMVVVQAAGQPAPAAVTAGSATLRPPVSIAVYGPAEGQTLIGDKVKVSLGINGATARAPVTATLDPKAGHFHLFLDTPVDLSTQVNVGGTNVGSNSFTLEGVTPGAHTLFVVWTYDNNISPQPPITATVRFTTVAAPPDPTTPGQPAAPAVRPPSAGDAGMLASQRRGGAGQELSLAAALPVLLLAAGLSVRARVRAKAAGRRFRP